MLSTNLRNSDLPLKLCFGVAWYLACTSGLRMACSADDVKQESIGNSQQWVAIKTPKKECSEIDDLRAEVRALRMQVHLLGERLRRQSPQSERTPKGKETQPPHKNQEPQKTLYFFTASWCTPCQAMNPVIERLKQEGYLIREVNVDNEKGLAKRYDVSSIPFFLMLIDGKEADHIAGLATENQLREMLRQTHVRRERMREVKEYRGSVADRAIESFSPTNGIISDPKAWKELCEAWKVDDTAIQIDFDRQLMIVATTDGSGISTEFERDGHGNLKCRWCRTLDLRSDGFRYLFAVIDRKGIKSVNGKELSAFQTQARR